MPAIIDKFLARYFSKKLFSYFIVTGVTLYAAHISYDLPDGFFHMAIAYVGSQGFIDAVAKYKGA